MHNILEEKKEINVEALIGHLNKTKKDRDTLMEELVKISKNPFIDYQVPCSGDQYTYGETIKVESIPDEIINRLKEEISKREKYIWDLLKNLEDRYTEGF